MGKRGPQPKRAARADSVPVKEEGLDAILSLDIGDLGSMAPPNMGSKAPSQLVDGRPNPAYYKYLAAFGLHFQLQAMLGEVTPPSGWNLKAFQEAVMMAAKLNGLDPRHVMDARSENQIAEDTVTKLLADRELFALLDREIECLEKAFEDGLHRGEQYFQEVLGRKDGVEAVGKWKRMLLRLKSIRKMVREKVPDVPSYLDKDRYNAEHPWKREIWEITHCARLMLYVMRTTMTGKDDEESFLKLAMHHYRILGDAWSAENGVFYHRAKTTETYGVMERDRSKYPYKGVVESAPPGHGKTTTAHGWTMHHLVHNQDAQGTWLHDVQAQADSNVEYVKRAFSPSDAMGRRLLSLYPHIRLSDVGNGKGELRFDTDKAIVGPNLKASSINGSKLGINNSFQIRDDIVPLSDEHSETERTRRVDTLNTVWETRLRGKHTFSFNIGTMLHHEDALSKLFQSANRKRNPTWLITRIQVCRRVVVGGRIWYEALWPEMYDSKFLSARYESMENKYHWFANYEGNPHPQQSQIIRTLRYFDPSLDEHRVFVSGASGHVSLDPAWTMEKHSDMAGIVSVAVGSVQGYVPQADGSQVFDVEKQIRIVIARSEFSTATGLRDLLERVIESSDAIGLGVGTVHIETNAGGMAIVEQVENEYGIDVVKHPATRSKETRLRDVMLMLNDSPDSGTRACVLFPGKAKRDEDGRLVVDKHGDVVVERDPDYDWLYRQFLQFGMHRDDHCLDAITQVCRYLTGEVRPGVGVVSRAVFAAKKERTAKENYLDMIRRARKGDNLPDVDEYARRAFG